MLGSYKGSLERERGIEEMRDGPLLTISLQWHLLKKEKFCRFKPRVMAPSPTCMARPPLPLIALEFPVATLSG
jgi:hypothetical protein